jgi:hypothetical protein
LQYKSSLRDLQSYFETTFMHFIDSKMLQTKRQLKENPLGVSRKCSFVMGFIKSFDTKWIWKTAFLCDHCIETLTKYIVITAILMMYLTDRFRWPTLDKWIHGHKSYVWKVFQDTYFSHEKKAPQTTTSCFYELRKLFHECELDCLLLGNVFEPKIPMER